jgi:predicted PhzF superfamily epimerase YddE/YHI9
MGGWHLAMAITCGVARDQGEYCGRPSTLFLGVDEEIQNFVSGEVVELGQGTLTL